MDFTKISTLEYLKQFCSPGTMFWYSLPCTGGAIGTISINVNLEVSNDIELI
jgi:hypothetical protein